MGDVWFPEMARKIQLPMSGRPSNTTAAWATLTISYVFAWALWVLTMAYPSL